ncbi:MAG TPA: beta-galactosidase [Conexibacter sp.]|nr:beta-galactosidase [Conexibacter sp.]
MSTPTSERPVSVTFDGEGLSVDGAFRPAAAGQFEYWRNHRVHWDAILAAIRDTGVEIVSTFVCWDFHEVAPGELDFTGATYPTRDLAGFIDACAAHDLGVFIRVGPVIDAEWPTRGPAPDVATLERLDPRFRARTREYLAALAPVLVPRLASNGGPILLTGLDNEICFPYVSTGESSTVHAGYEIRYDEQLVLARYREWAQRTGRRDPATCRTPDFRSANLAETLDAFDFMTDTIGDYLKELKDDCERAGLDVPFFTNMKQFAHFVDWRAIEQRLGIVNGANLHMPNRWPGEQKLVASWYCRVLRATARFPWAPELQGGPSIKPAADERFFGVMDPDQPRFNALFSAALGLRGMSYYMLVERDDTHYAPINPIGVPRPQAARLVGAVEAVKQLRPDRQLADVGLIWSSDHHRMAVASQFDSWADLFRIGRQVEEPKELPAWWSVFRQLHADDADFGLATAANWDAFEVLIYAGPDFLAADELTALAGWVEAGGTLIVATALPERDRHGERSATIDAARASLLASGRVILRPWGRIADALRLAGAEDHVRAAEPGVWTSAYADADGWTVFVVNTGEAPASATLTLRADLRQRLAGCTATSLLTSAAWTIPTTGLWDGEPPLLAPNQVEAIRVPRQSPR